MNGFNPNKSELVASRLKKSIAISKSKACSTLKKNWVDLWENNEVTPQEVFNELGVLGKWVLLCGSIQIQYLQSIIDAENLLEGTNLTLEGDLGDSKYLTTGKPVTVNEEGTVTVTE